MCYYFTHSQCQEDELSKIEIHSLWNWTNEKSDIPTNHDSYGSNLYPIEKKYVDSAQTLNGHMEFYNRGEEKRLKKVSNNF